MNAKSKRTQVIFWLIIIGLLVSMLIAFTPTLNGLFGGNANQLQKGAPALVVNGETLYELDVARAQQNPPFNQGFQGEVGEDLNILLVNSLVQNTILNQAASNIKVSDGEVRAKVTEFREQQGLAGSRNDSAYLNLISQYGFDYQTFRDYWRQQIKVDKYQDSLTKNVTVSDAEVEAFYNLNIDNYNSEEKIKARVIVLDDSNKADEILAKAKAGDDFGTLAKDNSLERADRNGALGAAEGSTDPQPVGRAALPTEVADAAFALKAPGITEVVAASEKFYITKVEEFIAAAPEPLDTIKEKVKEEALDAKKAGVLEQSYTDLRSKAQISIPEGSTLTFNDTAVAKVGDTEIKRSELAQAVYLSPQIQQALNPGLEQIITGMFKPSYLEQMIDREVAYQGSKDIEGATFFGTKGLVSQQALQYISRDAAATAEEIQKYYDDNLARYTDPASAVVKRINFETQEAATKFRDAVLKGDDLQATAEANAGIVIDLGTVNPGGLDPELDDALFKTNAFDKIGDTEQEVSDVLVIREVIEEPEIPEETTETTEDVEESSSTEESEATETATEVTEEATETTEETTTEETTEEAAETTEETATEEAVTETTEEAVATEPKTKDVYVVLVGTRTAERVRPFEEVKAQVEETVLDEKRAELQKTWLEDLKEKIKVENLLASATPDIATPDATFETTPLDSEEAPDETQPEGEGAVEEIVEGTAAAASGAVTQATEAAEDAAEAVTETAENAAEAASETAENASEAVTETTENATEAVTETTEDASETETANNATEAVTEAAENATEAVGEIPEDTTEAMTEVAEDTTEVVTQTAQTTETENSGSITGGIGTSFNFAAMEKQATEVTEKIRALAGRTDLSEAEKTELEKLQTSLATAQRNIAGLRGAQTIYTVEEGDTLGSISEQFFKSAGKVDALLETNSYLIDDENKIFPGMILLIPKE